MKYLILAFVSGVSLLAHGLQFEHEFDVALQKAKHQDKEVMMMYSAVWYPECSYMKDVVFKDKKSCRLYTKAFYCFNA